MIAICCEHFHWTVEYCLSMIASRFFLMLEQANRQKMDHYNELCDISAISLCNADYYKALKEKYSWRLKIDKWPEPFESKDQEEKINPLKPDAIPAHSEQAKNAVMGMFAVLRRST